MYNASLEGDLFDKNCNLKNLTAPPPYYFNPAKPNFRQGRILGIIHDMIRKDYKKQEVAQRNYLWACYLNKTKTATQPNQQEIPNIMNHISTLETNQNLIINVDHKNTKAIQHFGNDLDHLANVVNFLIAFNPALVYARLQAQLDDLANHMTSLLDTIQQQQHQRLSSNYSTWTNSMLLPPPNSRQK